MKTVAWPVWVAIILLVLSMVCFFVWTINWNFIYGGFILLFLSVLFGVLYVCQRTAPDKYKCQCAGCVDCCQGCLRAVFCISSPQRMRRRNLTSGDVTQEVPSSLRSVQGGVRNLFSRTRNQQNTQTRRIVTGTPEEQGRTNEGFNTDAGPPPPYTSSYTPSHPSQFHSPPQHLTLHPSHPNSGNLHSPPAEPPPEYQPQDHVHSSAYSVMSVTGCGIPDMPHYDFLTGTPWYTAPPTDQGDSPPPYESCAATYV